MNPYPFMIYKIYFQFGRKGDWMNRMYAMHRREFLTTLDSAMMMDLKRDIDHHRWEHKYSKKWRNFDAQRLCKFVSDYLHWEVT